MRILVTGASNNVGQAVVEALAAAGHAVRAFGVATGSGLFANAGNVQTYPGWVETGGSVEPAASECQAIVHASCLDPPGKDKVAHAVHLERGTLYTRYAAERELVQRFVALFPADAPRGSAKSIGAAKAIVHATRASVPRTVLDVGDAAAAVQGVLAALSGIQDQAIEAAHAADATA
jgi:NAD(P)-dependent dehydrogenase (short-subunit alcohol dehydrogenase family)